jgi:hypothetical protein
MLAGWCPWPSSEGSAPQLPWIGRGGRKFRFRSTRTRCGARSLVITSRDLSPAVRCVESSRSVMGGSSSCSGRPGVASRSRTELRRRWCWSPRARSDPTSRRMSPPRSTLIRRRGLFSIRSRSSTEQRGSDGSTRPSVDRINGRFGSRTWSACSRMATKSDLDGSCSCVQAFAIDAARAAFRDAETLSRSSSNRSAYTSSVIAAEA